MKRTLTVSPAPRTSDAGPGGPGAIELRGLTKSFHAAHGEVQAVRGIDVRIDPGQTVALLGPNGAGKSTAIDMILGLTGPRRRHGRGVRRAPTGGDRGRNRRGHAADRRARAATCRSASWSR